MADLKELTGEDTLVPIQSGLDFDEDLDKLFMPDCDPSEKYQVERNASEADNTEGNAPFNPFLGSNSYHDTFYPHAPSKQYDSLSAREQPACSFTHHPFTHTLSGNPRFLSDSTHLNEDIPESPRLLFHSTHLSEDASDNQSIVSHSTHLSEEIFSTPHNYPSASHFSLPSVLGHEASLQNLVQLMQKSERSRRDLRKVKMYMKREQQVVKKKYQGLIKGISYADIKWSRSKKRNIE